MSDFDSSFEGRALAKLFRPRMVSDPNAKGMDQFLRRSGRSRPRGSSTKARLARVVSRAPEVMVKVTSRQYNTAQLGNRIVYIGRESATNALETRDGDQIADRDDMRQIARDWGSDTFRSDGCRIVAVSMMFSMPEGTDPGKVMEAARAVAQTEIADEWDYVMALHTDRPQPHVHFIVEAAGETGRRFNPRQATLYHFRERFAEELRTLGIAAEATPRMARGIGAKGPSTAVRKMQDRFELGQGPRPRRHRRVQLAARDDFLGKGPPPAFVAASQESWQGASGVYLSAADRLARSNDPAERQLAAQVREFVRAGRVPTVHEQLVASLHHEKARRTGVARSAPKNERERLPEDRQRQAQKPERRPKPPDRTR